MFTKHWYHAGASEDKHSVRIEGTGWDENWPRYMHHYSRAL